MVSDTEHEGPAAGLDHGNRGVATERLTGDDPDGTAGGSRAAAADATRQARGHEQQSDNNCNREDQS